MDERATAFMALGYGRATGNAAAWITTSGTALANGYPAIVEASLEAVPMLLLTADRPPELRDTDANQTIRQDHLFGMHVRWFVDIPTPSDDVPASWLLSTVDEAVHRGSTGPVHLNCMFRKPLVPAASETLSRAEWWESETRRTSDGVWQRWLASGRPFTEHMADASPDYQAVKELADRITSASRPLFVFGRLRGDASELSGHAARVAEAFGTVGLVDIGSQMRTGMTSEVLIPALDAILYGGTRDAITPDLIVQFGATPVSKRQVEWAPDAQRIVIDDRPRRVDPASRGGMRVHADPLSVMRLLLDAVEDRPSSSNNPWKKLWLSIGQAVSDWMASDLGSELTEQQVARTFSASLPADASLTVASSNPVRHADLYGATDGHRVPVSLNRGASGIDGTLATACGFSDGSSTRPCILIGDLALQHDLTSLALCAERKAIVVVINNDGGGIFSYLPIREHEEVFEPWFGTPHGQDFEHAVRHFGLDYATPDSLDELDRALAAAADRPEGSVIEVKTDRSANLVEQRRLLRALQARLDALLGPGGNG